MKTKPRYQVKNNAGATIWTKPPPYERPDKGKFVLNDATQKDLAYLYEIIGIKDKIEIIQDKADPVEEKPE